MKSRKIVFIVVTWLLIAAFSGCGGDKGGGRDTIYVCVAATEEWVSVSGTIPTDLSGSYFLSTFEWDFYTVFGNYIRTITDDDFTSAAGALDIYSLSADISYSIIGSANLTGSWYLTVLDQPYTYAVGAVSWMDTATGTVILDGEVTPFEESGGALTFSWPLGCFLLEQTVQEEPPAEPASYPAGVPSSHGK